MLTRLHVQGYKALRDIDTSLEPLTVIVGPNGCGKTSVLEAIAMVRDLPSDVEDFALQELRWKNDSKISSINVDLRAQLEPSAEDALRRDPGGNARIEVEIGFSSNGGLSITWDGKPKMHSPHDPADPRTVRASAFRRSIRLLKLEAEKLARPSYAEEVAPRIGNDGNGLATVLSTLAGEDRERFDDIQEQLREFVPEIDRIRIRTAPVPIVESREVPVALDPDGKEVLATRHYRRNVVGHEVLFDYRHANGIVARHASEGTLLLLGLLTVMATDGASVLLLDDVDRALHPKAQQQLVAYFRELTRRGTQVIATTHSPYLVLHLEYEEIRAMLMSDTEGSLIGKLTDHPEYERWRESMTPSEFWTVFGEEWLAKSRKKAEGNG